MGPVPSPKNAAPIGCARTLQIEESQTDEKNTKHWYFHYQHHHNTFLSLTTTTHFRNPLKSFSCNVKTKQFHDAWKDISEKFFSPI
jgi:hypothetical protein